MNITRNGKIARLPRAIRQELNRRLDDGEQGKKLVAWLNGLPEVQAVVAAEFGGKPIREQNLSEWKQRAYRDWVAQQQAREVVERLNEDAAEWDAESRAPLTNILSRWLAARYAVATRRVSETRGPKGWRLLREMCGDIVELRKGDHSRERLQIDRERLKLEKEKSEKQICEKVAELMKQPGRNGEGLSQEERARLMREFFGLPPEGKGRNGLTSETLAEIERAAKILS
jgi:signal transduction histidine kinase